MQLSVFLQPAQYVFHAHHSIVHQLTNRNRQPAQRHGVDGEAKVLEG